MAIADMVVPFVLKRISTGKSTPTGIDAELGTSSSGAIPLSGIENA
jgi:hypothetical protein